MTLSVVLSHTFAFVAGGVVGLMASGLLVVARGLGSFDDRADEPEAVGSQSVERPAKAFPRMLGLAAAAALLTALVVPPPARAESAPAAEHGGGAEAAAAEPAMTARSVPPPAPRGTNAEQYCQGVAQAAQDARFARQKAALEAMQKTIDERIAALEAKRADYETWLSRREEFLKQADENLLAVFSQMRPDAASAQLTIMGDDPAAAILARLNPRVASAILNEMEPARAARLTGVMVGIAKRARSNGTS
ncbi:MotE family protein [Prosthecomicrobium pneumaticum]|uniref:Flagellar motility protein MotE (MotC chaperone) n=1 Tax=Prosthecomicrobium pneumaticum TaxID=81895 RepID=A0A7W9CSB8_9HYPH|nr:MotE family protein [Prosthecomicrobium pneumaticum]MBB5751020.1 flagellar motility protein MotE (MotC chaperone) [Prosthecomicrobium pneumaticum]